MNHIQTPNHFGKQHLQSDEALASWVNIVDLVFDIVRHQERLAIKRKALGRHERSLALRNQTRRGLR